MKVAGSVDSSARDVPGRDGVGDGQSRLYFNFQVHVRRTTVGATGVIQKAQESFRGLFGARKG
jgi:hypothetical protein